MFTDFSTEVGHLAPRKLMGAGRAMFLLYVTSLSFPQGDFFCFIRIMPNSQDSAYRRSYFPASIMLRKPVFGEHIKASLVLVIRMSSIMFLCQFLSICLLVYFLPPPVFPPPHSLHSPLFDGLLKVFILVILILMVKKVI